MNVTVAPDTILVPRTEEPPAVTTNEPAVTEPLSIGSENVTTMLSDGERFVKPASGSRLVMVGRVRSSAAASAEAASIIASTEASFPLASLITSPPSEFTPPSTGLVHKVRNSLDAVSSQRSPDAQARSGNAQ